MKKIRSVFVHGLLCAGMVYGLMSIAVLPAYACTPSQCAIAQQDASSICANDFGCNNGGRVVICDSTHVVFFCTGCGNFNALCQ